MQLDKENINNLWLEATKKELNSMSKYKVFRFMKKGDKPLEGYTFVPYHIVYGVKYDGRHKARLVAGGNWTNLKKEDTYSGVV